MALYVRVISLMVAFATGNAWVAQAQETKEQPPRAVVPAKPVASASPDAEAEKWCDVYIMEDSPRDMLVFDQDGKLMADVRHVYIWFQIATKQPQARMYRWPGIYKPAKVVDESWPLRKLKVVDEVEFHRLVEQGGAGE